MIIRLSAYAMMLLIMPPGPPGALSRADAEAAEQGEAGAITATVQKRAVVRSEPSLQAEVLASLKAGSKIDVVAYLPERKFFMIRYKRRPGYLESDAVKLTEKIEDLIKRAVATMNSRAPDGRKGSEPGDAIQNPEAKRQVLTLLYGEEIAARLMDAKVWRGMTKEMAIQSIGEPKSVKRTEFPNVIKEEWLYDDGTRLYFENDVLKAYGGPPMEVPGP